eukprot:TRINITY_DN15847_c0_g1_i1.p1 TRINITY_DN15847_c0_g1~~TRINITY_DN15847_c0_g1_i1.p1  ORF type:complete len:358 (+),score=115.04 TRINITY_DN15847_c0_g1_i1:35-1108(+)
MSLSDFNKIPIIDISSLYNDENELEKKNTLNLIKIACENIGFFCVTGHDIPGDLITSVCELTYDFFKREEEFKNKINRDKFFGYFGLGTEITSNKKDWHEGIDLCVPRMLTNDFVLQNFGENKFPAIDNFKETVESYLDKMEGLGKLLVESLAINLDLDIDQFSPSFLDSPFCTCRLLGYPPQPQTEYLDQVLNESNQSDNIEDISENNNNETGAKFLNIDDKNIGIGVGKHTDYGGLTLLYASEPGLQVQNRSDEWINVPVKENMFVVNIGNALEYYTNGLYVATPHRVVFDKTKARKDYRISIPFFFDPSPGATIKPLNVNEENINNNKNKDLFRFSEISYGDYILDKYKMSFDD